MKVYFLVADLGNGGQERQLTYLLKGLHNLSHEVKVITWNTSVDGLYANQIKALGIEIVQLTRYSSSIWGRIKALNKILRTEKPAILQSYSFYLNAFAFCASLFTPAKAWGAIRSRMDLYKLETPYLVYLMSSLLPFRFISNNYSFASGKIPGWHKKVLGWTTKVIPNGIDLDHFLGKDEIRTNKTFITSSVGRVSHEKRIDLLIKIHKYLKEKGITLEHHHAGDGIDLETYKAQIRKENLEQTFIFSGTVTDISSFLKKSDLFIFTSDFEGSPNAVMEAMVSGLPVITTDCGDVTYLLDHGKGGYIFPVGDWSKIAEHAELLIHNKALRDEYAEYNLHVSKNKFSINKMVDSYLGVYKKSAQIR